MIVVIDGPSVSGKSSVAQQLARDLGWYYLNTGFLYRGLAYSLCHWHGYTIETLSNVEQVAIDKVLQVFFTYRYDLQGAHIFYGDQEITQDITSSQWGQAASRIGLLPYVRDAINVFQKKLVKKYNCVADGRDLGTIVFPSAEYKFFLTASTLVRAQRFVDFRKKYGETISLEEAYTALCVRDTQDKERIYAPLRKAIDAYEIDSSNMTIQDVVQIIKKYIGST